MKRTSRNKDDVSLSKTLSWLLRHSAVKEGLHMSEDGFVNVNEILNHKLLRQRYTLEDVQRVVEENDKQRFTLSPDPDSGVLRIKANQGHSLKEVHDTSLVPILREAEAPVVIHGTYNKNWERIRSDGLSKMKRLHIHFAPGEPGQSGVISGMRKTCDLYIYIDIGKALADGIKFYRSSNNVILSPGDERGIIEPKYFAKVVHMPPSKSS